MHAEIHAKLMPVLSYIHLYNVILAGRCLHLCSNIKPIYLFCLLKKFTLSPIFAQPHTLNVFVLMDLRE